MAKRISRQSFDVYLDSAELGGLRKVGTLFRHENRTDVPAAFEYEKEWLRSGDAFMLDPRLELYPGEQYPPDGSHAFGIFMDSAPDRWGRVLMERREAVRARREGRPVRSLQEMDFLLGVNDLTRTGALRFKSKDAGAYLDASENAAPPFTRLQELAEISRRIESKDSESLPEYERWLAMLIAPGTSLGGARPKANFEAADGRLWLAKFPSAEDRYDVGAWEYLANRLAQRAGIVVPEARLEALAPQYHTYCAARFDRVGQDRRMFASAMTLSERRERDPEASYLDLAEFIANQGAPDQIEADLEQLFRRVAFNVLIGNRDDHLRNHGFIREKEGWRLAPAYDVNPNPAKAEHALRLDASTAVPDIKAVRESAEYYRLDGAAADRILGEIREVLKTWRGEAGRLGLSRMEMEGMGRVIQSS